MMIEGARNKLNVLISRKNIFREGEMLRADKDFLKKPVHFYKQKKRTNHTIFFKPYKTVKFS